MRVRTAILVSGRGSNMRALVEAARHPGYPAQIALVLSNRPDAPALDWARAHGVETAVVDHRAFFRDREAFERALHAELEARDVGCVALAGFMRVLTPSFVGRWTKRLVNIHPSLLPAFPGLDTHARALAAGVGEHGCTVHFVAPEVDAGPIIAQARVPVLADDTADALAARVLEAEHRLYPAALRDVLAPPFPVVTAPSGGAIAIARCPGRDRPVAGDVEAHARWGAAALVTLVTDRELASVGALDLGRLAVARGLAWHHLPIADFAAPDMAWHRLWEPLQPHLIALLRRGDRVSLHCFGGQGRSGMVAARLLAGLGLDPATAIAQVRAARPGAIETGEQERWVSHGAA
jgi:phosphoribosylglycinamide formyltransferase-1